MNMEKLLKCISFIFIVGLLCACEHVDLDKYIDKKTEKTGNTIVFTILPYQMSDFSDTEGVTVRATKPVKDICSRVDMVIFSGDNKVRSISQDAKTKDFGVISTQLPAGSYNVVIIAHNGKGKATISSPKEIKFSENKVTDTFYYCKSLTINGEAQYDVVLKRAVAKFVLKLNDRVPTDVKQFQLTYTGGSSTFNAETGFGSVKSRQTEIRAVAPEAYQTPSSYEIYTFPHADGKKLKITVLAQDGSKNTIQERVFENVPVEINKVTTYSGSFFQNTEPGRGASFTLVADEAWDSQGYNNTY
ncbi:hypothetical protein C3V39_12375 [Prevotella sp. oral taxon 820]|nr:hypothetical protein C3V39_12375 [Prevotella sp. oral taxon 820]